MAVNNINHLKSLKIEQGKTIKMLMKYLLTTNHNLKLTIKTTMFRRDTMAIDHLFLSRIKTVHQPLIMIKVNRFKNGRPN